MTIRHRFFLMLDMMLEKKRNLFFSILMLTATFTMFLVAFLWYLLQGHDLRAYEKCYAVDISEAYHLQVNNIDADIMMDMETTALSDAKREISQLTGVNTIGAFTIRRNYLTELKTNEQYIQLMEAYDRETEAVDFTDAARIIYADESMLSIVRNHIQDECLSEWNNLAINPILVGEAFRDIIRPGDTLHYGDQEFVVTGYLRRGDKWMSDGPIVGKYTMLNSMEYMFLTPLRCIGQEGLQAVNSIYLVLGADGTGTVRKQCAQICKRYGIDATVVSVRDSLSTVYQENAQSERIFRTLLIFMGCISIFACTSATTIAYLLRERKLGVWYAFGMLPSDLAFIIILEQLIKVVVSACLSYSVVSAFADSEVLRGYYHTYGLCALLGISAGVVILTSIVPVLYMLKKQPMRLLRTKG